jgi:S1-C subfamily serine protease
MTQLIEWINDNWLAVAIPLIVFLAFWTAGLWLRRIAFDAFNQWLLKAKWELRQLFIDKTRTPFLHWFLLLGAYISIRVSVLPLDAKAMAGKIIASLFVFSLIWVAISLSEKVVKFYLPKLRLYLAKVKAPQPPTTLAVNIIRAMVIVVGVSILLGIWGAPNTWGILVLAAGVLIAGLALRDVTAYRSRFLKIRKLFINLLVIAGLGLVAWTGYLLFTHQTNATSGTVTFLLEVGFLTWIISVLRSHKYKRIKPSFKLVFFSLLGIALVCSFAGIEPMSSVKDRATAWVGEKWETVTSVTPAPTFPTSVPEGVTSTVAKVEPAVVMVEVENSMGSGMIIDKSGYILTSNHIVEDVQSAIVILKEGGQFPGEVIGRDELRDLAIIKISASGFDFPVVTLGNSDELENGEEIIAIGYSLGLEGGATISKGIISAFRYSDGVRFIQTDAAINPGNSGGPLINLNAETIGIVTFKFVGEGVEGMGFAIAINDAKPFIANVEEKQQAQGEIEKIQKEIEALEQEVVAFANLERSAREIAPLIWDDELGRIAREHSQEMAERGELFHSSVDKPYAENCWGGSPGSFHYFGASDIVNTWMESPKHRTWLLCPHLKHIGVGIAVSDGAMYASWTFWRSETSYSDWWYDDGGEPSEWWY